MSNIKPEAYSDAVHIFSELKRSLQPVSVIEVHLFAYLACILSLWKGTPLSQWGYSFAVTSEGFPYSADFEDARVALMDRGLASSDDEGRLCPNQEMLENEITDILSAERWKTRRLLARDAVGCALAFPLGSIRFAIGQSPGMKNSVQLHQRSALFSDSARDRIYDEYSSVREAMGTHFEGMLAPAVVWLSARILEPGSSNVEY